MLCMSPGFLLFLMCASCTNLFFNRDKFYPACQQEDWAVHKPFCRAIVGCEQLSSIHSPPISASEESRMQTVILCQLWLKRNLVDRESSMILYEPACLSCGVTNRMIHASASTDPPVDAHTLVPCQNCLLSFACRNHWEIASIAHTEMMCEGGYDGLSQCALNGELLEDDEWDSKVIVSPHLYPLYSSITNSYRWIPSQIESSWTSIKATTWAETFQSKLESEFLEARGAASSVWLRRMSEILSMPMTVLYALEILNDNIDWTIKNTLTIHVVFSKLSRIPGPKEAYNAVCFENLLHRLPRVQTVNIVICGVKLESTLDADLKGGPYPIICCPHHSVPLTSLHSDYYKLPQKIGPGYSIPDLAIAFNSGASEAAYAPEEAIADNALLVECGAELVPELGPGRNPWGSMLGKKDVVKIRSFYADNMFLAGGFKGR
ncbi:hypothetical protein C8R43DRAFT_965137 [Mycena crocata]|nr:hypothetical protein C8R43DRAFT_965137 [Mycena crocata]